MEKHSQLSVAGTYHLTPQDHVRGNSPLHSACYHGKLGIVQLLILEQPSLDINVRNHRGDSPLTLACQAGHLDVIHFLLTLSSCDITHTNKAGDTPLHVACSEGHTAAVKVLCSFDKCAVDGQNRDGNSPLALAYRGGHFDVVKFLVESMHSSISTQNKDGDTPLHVACCDGNSQVVKFLVSISDSDINIKNTEGNTPLHLACQNGWKNIVEFLINESNHVNVNQPNNDGNTPLHVAISLHQKDIADLLSYHHKCDTKITNKDGNMPLYLACMEGWTDIVQYLLGTRGNDVNAHNIKGNTPLHISWLKGHTDIVKIIITQKSCDINCKDEHGNTPLNLACLEGKLDIVKLLADMKECDLNHKNKVGVCALQLAFYNRHQSVVEVLIRHDRCDVNCTDAEENTPLGLAANLSWTDVVKFLITEKQCNINHQNKFGNTPLHLSKCVNVAELLTECDVNCKNSRGDTALSIACQNKHAIDLVKFLIEQKHCDVSIQNEDGDSPLHRACRFGNLDAIKYLVNRQMMPVDCENNTGDTPLCVAADYVCNYDTVQFLVESTDCDVNHQNKNGDTPLHIACRIGDIRVVWALTSFRNRKVRCNFNIKNKQQETPALIAFRNCHIAVFRLLVTAHSYKDLFSILESVNKELWPEVVKLLTSDGRITVSPQFESQFDVLQFLFNERVWDLNGLDVHGNTPLHIACLAGDLNVVRLLTGIKDCNFNVNNKQQVTPALIAFHNHHNDVFRLLITERHCECLFSVLERISPFQWYEPVCNLRADQNINGKEVILQSSSFGSELNIISFLAEEKIWNVDNTIKYGNTLLHFLCQYSENPALLIHKHEAVKEVNCCNKAGNTPLHLACLAGNVSGVQYLTNITGCNTNIKNDQQETPALIAFRNRHIAIFRLLVTVYSYDNLFSVLENINKDLWPEVVKLLTSDGRITMSLQFQSQLDVMHFLFKERVWSLIDFNYHGNTPLHIACLAGDLNVVRTITSFANCHCNIQNKHGNTALSIACQSNLDLVKFLIETKHCKVEILNEDGDTPLHHACRHGKLSIVEYLLSKQLLSINCENNSGNTPLCVATGTVYNDIVLFLVEIDDCDVNHQNKNGDTPLHIACRIGDIRVVRALTDFRDRKIICNFNVANNQQETPALIAYNKHHNDICRLLVTEHHCDCLLSVLKCIKKNLWPEVARILATGRTVTVPSHFVYQFDVVSFLFDENVWGLNGLDVHGNTPLHIACHSGDLNIVRIITSFADCNFNIKNKDGNTAANLITEHHYKLLISMLENVNEDVWTQILRNFISDSNSDFSFGSHFDVIHFLFEKGVWDLNGIDVHGNTPLHIACLSGDLNIVRIITRFADCNFNIKNKDGSTAAQLAYQKGYYGVVKQLIIICHMCFIQILETFSHQEGPDIMDLRGHFYLFHFSQLGIQKTWNPNHQDKFGNTLLHYACLSGSSPLHIACLSNNTRLIKFLIDEEGCDVNACNRGGDTPLHTACSIGNMRFLLSVANCNAQIVNGDTPLHIACKAGKSTVMCLINHSKCDVNCQNSSGDTPLHLACRLDAGDIGFSIVQSLLTHEKCMLDIQNHDGDTPLTLACQFASQPIVQQLITSNKCNINHQNKDGNSPLHNACRSGNLVIVKALLTKNCNIVLRNKQGETPALVAFNHQQPDILRLLITEEHCEWLIDLLGMISKEKWPDVVKILIGNKTLRTNVSTFSSALDVVKLLVWNHIWNINSLDESGNSVLHRACYYGHTGLVQFLVDDQKFDIMCSNSSGNTPLHIACLQGHSEVVKAMLSAISRMKISCKPDVSNNQGETPLHFACTKGHLQVVKMLLLSGFFNPTACNIAGITPVELASNYRVITELLSRYVGFQSSNPLWSNIKVCIVGNHATGKTTLVQVLQREAKLWMKVFPKKFKKVLNVESCTCGIIPVQLHSKRFGNVILYDFAGHEEYYSSHAAVLENFRSSSPPPLFIILIKLVESEEEISRKLYYWTSMVENHCKTTQSLPRVIIVGSFADKVKEFLPQKAKHVKKLLGLLVDESLSNLCSLQFVGFVPLDCRILASQGNDTLCNLLAANCHSLQEAADTSFGCHVLYALLSDKFTGNVACTVSEILTCIHSDDACGGLLPHDTGNLVHLLKTLSDYGEIVLLLNQERPENSWVVLDKTVLLSEINGTVFAPEHFERRYKGFLMSTGVVPLTKLQDAFPDYDPEMITSFLIHLEFCQEVKDPDALGGITATHLQLTQSTTPSAVTERYFFFPALVNLEKPTDVWEDNEAIHYSCGWLLRCIKPDKFLTFRFIHVLLLRLAFSYALTPESHHYPEDPSYPVLRKRCSVWKNGIQWFSRAGGIETIVEVREQTKRVAILMRCPTKAEIECAKLRSSVIEKVLSIQNEFCPAVTPMAECLIHPNDVQYPLPSTEQLKLFSHKEIAELVIANPEQNEQFAIGEIPSSVTDAQQLLSFEPYLGLGEALVQQLFSDKDADKTVSETFLDKLAERVFQRMSMFKKMFNTSENEFAECHGQAEVRQCCYLFKLWSQQREKATYRSLRKEFDRNSIFHGRNPLEVARSGTASPIPLQDIDYDTPDTTTDSHVAMGADDLQSGNQSEQKSKPSETKTEILDKTSQHPQDTNSHDSEVVLQSRDSHSITSDDEDSDSKASTTTVGIVSHPSDHPMEPNTDSKKDAPNHNSPTLLELIRFRGRERRINVPQEIGVHYMTFGILLLEDPNGMRIRNMERKHMKNPEQINMEVLQEWVQGGGKQPVTWDTLIDVLRDTESADLTRLASEIGAVKGSSIE